MRALIFPNVCTVRRFYAYGNWRSECRISLFQQLQISKKNDLTGISPPLLILFLDSCGQTPKQWDQIHHNLYILL